MYFVEHACWNIVVTRFGTCKANTKTNPFTCPTCRESMPLVACVKQFLSPQEMERVRKWVKDVQNPPCYSLPVCLKKHCLGTMRRNAEHDDLVYCEECEGQWCERCLQRAPNDQEHDSKENPCKLGSSGGVLQAISGRQG